MKKTIEQIQEWLNERSFYERDLWCIYGYLPGQGYQEYAYRWKSDSRQRHTDYHDFIQWYNEEE